MLAMLMAFAGFAQCAASFTTTSSPVAGGNLRIALTSTATPTSTTYPLGKQVRVKWGDGMTEYTPFATTYHNYASPGSYTIWQIIRVFDTLTNVTSCIDSISHTVTVSYSPCAISASATVNPLTNQATITVTPLGSSTNLRYTYFAVNSLYTFVANTASTSFSVTYTTPGSKAVHIYSQDSATGCMDSLVVSFNVTNGCVGNNATFTYGKSGMYGAWFNNTTTGGVGLTKSYKWLFGDGTTSTATYPTHVFPGIGTYNVCLICTWRDGSNNITCVDTFCNNITFNGQCDGLDANYGKTVSGLTAMFYNYSSNIPDYTNDALWIFGDGSTGTGDYIAHNYSTAGTYNVCLINTWRDSITNAVVCVDTFCNNVTVNISCSNMHASFTSSFLGALTMSFNNTSTNIPGTIKSQEWIYGDGTNGTSASKTYAYPGAYNVCLINTWKDSNTNAFICVDTACDVVYVQHNIIRGDIWQDSSVGAFHVDSAVYKVWLIQFDSVTNNLSAVDSQLVYAMPWVGAVYTFNNPAPGTYRVKAKLLNGPTSGIGYVPTYHFSSLMWNTATLIYHPGGITDYKNIQMQTGTVTAGPGFVAGNVSAGANKGTNSGIEGETVVLLDGLGKIVSWSTTDANGDFSFNNLPPAVYSVYPEELGFATTPVTVTVLNNNATITNVNFLRSESKKTITPGTTSIANINSQPIDVSVFPNPSKDKVTIQWNMNNTTAAEVVITDITGKKIMTRTITDSKSELSLGHLQKGMYFITISSGEAVHVQKLMLQ